MEFTEEQKKEFKSQFATRRRNQIIAAIPVVLLMIIYIFSQQSGTDTIMGFSLQSIAPIAAIFFLGVLVFSFKNWRCPSCNKYLGRSINPKYCTSCGIELH